MATTEDATATRIWPHHFDMATLIMLPGTKNGSPFTVGVGLSPGDTSYHEPFFLGIDHTAIVVSDTAASLKFSGICWV